MKGLKKIVELIQSWPEWIRLNIVEGIDENMPIWYIDLSFSRELSDTKFVNVKIRKSYMLKFFNSYLNFNTNFFTAL